MRGRWLAWIASTLLLLPGFGQATEQTSSPNTPSFVVFDGTMYMNKPNMRSLGVEPLYIAYEPNLFTERNRALRPPDAMPDPALLDAQIAAARATDCRVMIIDIEAWSVYKSTQYPNEVAANIARYVQTLQMTRPRAPELYIGLYGPLPVHTGYPRLIAPKDSALYNEMVTDNNNLFGLASMVDAIFPIGYTYTENRDEWKLAVTTSVDEARRLNPAAPIYIFLWPQYADYGPTPPALYYQWLSTDYWRFQLDTAREIADGVVIWGGWDGVNGGRRQWDGSAAWWQETRDFMRDNGLWRDPDCKGHKPKKRPRFIKKHRR